MNKRSTLSLPAVLFSDDAIEIKKLVSEGLILKHGSLISFTHQSLFDYFATDGMIRQIYKGDSIIDIIGDRDDQTPFIRYRFISVLQQLADTEDSLFTYVSQEILASSRVRFYFKSAVPEIAGQQKMPSAELFSLVYSLFHRKEWHDAVLRRVYYGHLPYILDLDRHGYFGQLSDEALGLLRSVYPLSPDFVIDKIACIEVQNLEDARRIYQVLSPDLSCDTPRAQGFRLALIEQHPSFYNNEWGLHQLAKSKSPYLITYLKSMVAHIDSINRPIYLSEEKTYRAYARVFYREMIEELLPAVVATTAQFHPLSDPNIRFNESFNRWLPLQEHHHFARVVVNMLISAMTTFYQNEPQVCIDFISSYSGEESVVLYEVFASCVLSMGTDDSDFAIQWLCDDPQDHLFIYTNRQDDYLSITKEIIAKYSPYCSPKVFRRLENIVYYWKEPAAKMIQIYRHRIESRRYAGPAYVAYWGMLQKDLLPHMDPSRLSKKSKELLRVLERNEWIRDSFYNCGFSYTRACGIASPIDGKLDRISDSTWLRIIATPKKKMSNRFSHDRIDGDYIEVNHESFASSLSRAARKEPVRFAELALKFPEGCPDAYITGVLNAIRYPEDGTNVVEKETLFPLVSRFKGSDNPHTIQEIMSIIELFAHENWPDDIIDYVCDTAAKSVTEEPDQPPLLSGEESSDAVNSLLTEVNNSIPGHTFKTMGKLLKHHSELFDRFLPIIESSRHNSNDVVRYALTYCLYPLYQIDPEYTLTLFRELLSQDIRTLSFTGAWDLILEDHESNGSFYAQMLSKAVVSNINIIHDEAAGMLCAYTVFFDQMLLSALCSSKYTKQQVNEICCQAIYTFDRGEYHEISRDILFYFINAYDEEIFELNRLFEDHRINIYRDMDFLTALMESKQAQHISYRFLEYIKAQDQDITLYLDTLRRLSENALTDRSDWRTVDVINDLTVIILRILDQNRYDHGIKQVCLDIWDNIYQNCFDLVKPLTELLEYNG